MIARNQTEPWDLAGGIVSGVATVQICMLVPPKPNRITI